MPTFFFDDTTGANQSGGIGSSLEAGVHSALAGVGAIGAATGLTGPGYMLEQQRAAQVYSQQAGAAGIPQSMDEVHGPTDLLKYAGGQVLQSAPVLGEVAAGAMLGGVPDALVGAGTAVARNVAKDAIEHAVASGVDRAVAEKAVGTAIARSAAGGAATYPGAVGQNLQTQYDQSGNFNLPVAAATAVPEAALNVAGPEGRMARGVFEPMVTTGSRVANALGGLGIGAAAQGAVGAAQGEIQEINKASVDQSYDLLGAESLKNVAASAAGNAVVGGLIQGVHSGLHTPGAAGGVSSRDVQAETPDSSTNPPDQPVNMDSRPAYQRAGKVIPGVTDQFGGTGDAVGAEMTQQDLPLQGGRNPAGFTPGFDARGNPLPRTGAPADATAATTGPGPARTEADAIAGLQAMHRDTTAQLQQALAQGGDGTSQVKALNDQLQTLKAEPAPGQRSLDFSAAPERQGAGIQSGSVLFADKDGLQQLNTAQSIVTDTTPPPQPATQPLQVPQQLPKPVAAQPPGAIPNGSTLADRRVPPVAPTGRVITPEERPGFQMQGHPTPQFDTAPTGEARPPLTLEPQDGRQGQLPLEQPAVAPLPNSEGTAARPNDTQTGDMFGGGQSTSTPWQTRMRVAWKDASDGSLQGFHKAMATVLKASSPEEAAAAIRDKANNQSTSTSFEKLDAVHRALTGEGIEEGATREARETATKPTGETSAPEGDSQPAVEPGRVEPQAPAEDARVSPPEAEAGATPEREAAVETPEAAADTQPKTDYQKRAEDVQGHIQALESTKDQAEFQQHVNALYRIWQNRAEGDRAAHTADIYLHDPENGVTDDNLKKAADQYDQDEINNWVAHNVPDTMRAAGDHNPDTGNRTMLPEAARTPGAQHTAGSMMRSLATSAKSPAVRLAMQIASKYRELNDTPIHIVHAGEQVPSYIERQFQTGADAVTAAHADGRSEIYVRAEAADEETMAHEILHAALPHALEDGHDGGATALMAEVRNAMQEAGLLDTPEGKFFEQEALRNPNEFLSYGMSSPTMQHLFEQMAKPTLWDRFKSVIGKVLSVPRAFLDRIMGNNRPAVGDTTPTLARLSRVLEDALQRDTPQREAARIEMYRQTAVSPAGVTVALKDGLEDVWSHLKSMASRVSMASMPTHAMADAFGHDLPALRDVTHAIDDRTVDQHEMARKAAVLHDTINQAYKAGGKSLDRFNSVIEDTQIAHVDPRIKGSLDRAQLNLIRAKDEFDKTGRAKDATPLQRASAARVLREAVATARLADNWSKMSAPERKAVGDSFDALKESMARRTEATNAILLRSADGFHDETLDEMRANGASQDQINDQILRTYGRIFNTAQEPYAPLRRYGDWVTTASSKDYRAAEAELRAARVAQAGEAASGEVSGPTQERTRIAEQHLSLLNQDPEHRIVEFHDSSTAASKRVDQLKADHPDMETQRFARADYMQHAGSLSGGVINKIIEAVGQQLPDELRDNIGAVIREMYVDSLPDNSFDQSMQGRGGVAGYSTDFSRGILDTLLRDSFNISTIEHGDNLGAAMSSLDEQRRANGGDNANNIYKELTKRIAFTTDHKNFRAWEQRMSEVTHAFYLGFSPGFMLMNGMQMPMITMPMLYARYGLHANGTMSKAISDIWDSVKKGNLDHTNSARMTDSEKEVLTRLQNLGILNMTQLHDMAMTARSSNIIDPQTAGEKVTKGWEVSKDMANLPAQYVETVNRAASALAAYRLAVEGQSKFGKMEHGAAMDYAAKIVRDSHVDYSAVNNAAWLRAPGGRFLFQFKKYWLNMLSMVSTNMWDAFGHHDDVKQLRNGLADTKLTDEERSAKQSMLDTLMERRAVARRTLAGLYGAHYLLTGAMGMPFAGTAMALSSVMRNWYNDPEDKADTKTDLQNWLSGVFGVGPADVMMHGIFGGIFGVNAERIGMGDYPNPIKVTAQRAGEGSKDMLDQVLLGALGPTVGLGQQIFQGIDQMTKGNYARGLEQMLPRTAGDVLKATRYAGDQGVDTTAGKQVTPLSNLDAIKQALGLQPEAVANAYQARDASTDAKDQFIETRKGLIASLAQAQKTGENTPDAQGAVDAFNQRNPAQGLRITVGDVIKARNAIGAAPKTPTDSEAAVAARTDKGAFAR
jgi:hypothetical protein